MDRLCTGETLRFDVFVDKLDNPNSKCPLPLNSVPAADGFPLTLVLVLSHQTGLSTQDLGLRPVSSSLPWYLHIHSCASFSDADGKFEQVATKR